MFFWLAPLFEGNAAVAEQVARPLPGLQQCAAGNHRSPCRQMEASLARRHYGRRWCVSDAGVAATPSSTNPANNAMASTDGPRLAILEMQNLRSIHRSALGGQLGQHVPFLVFGHTSPHAQRDDMSVSGCASRPQQVKNRPAIFWRLRAFHCV